MKIHQRPGPVPGCAGIAMSGAGCARRVPRHGADGSTWLALTHMAGADAELGGGRHPIPRSLWCGSVALGISREDAGDYTKMVQQQRQIFTKSKQRLQELNLLYTLVYPAWMRAVYESQTHFFDTLVLRWTDEKVGMRPHTPPHVDLDSSQGPDGLRHTTAFKKKQNRSRSKW
ncbi:hypothetical protein NDU88_004146 [Pleurodeles waltl]|uniref:Uncharacterized protein n=1 Tax=Pleurodeles waltl TaxID=8319 RepID=A0AAV7M655_PLEWA|nr:hypothetical protein NDU88_004146 [Pleurodeles waltl]